MEWCAPTHLSFCHPFVHKLPYIRTFHPPEPQKSAVLVRKLLIHSAEHYVLAPLFNTVLTRVESFLTFCNRSLTKLATRFWHQFGTSLAPV